jgi:hypothetical protein
MIPDFLHVLPDLKSALNFDSLFEITKRIDYFNECYNNNSYATKCNIYTNNTLPELVTLLLEKSIYNTRFPTHTCPVVNNCKLKMLIVLEKPNFTLVQIQPENKADISKIIYLDFEEPEDLYPLLYTANIIYESYNITKTSKFIYKFTIKNKQEIKNDLNLLYALIHIRSENEYEHTPTNISEEKIKELITTAEYKLRELRPLDFLETKFALIYLYSLIDKKYIKELNRHVILEIVNNIEILKRILLK